MCVQGAEIKTIGQEVPIQGQLTQKQPAPAPKPIKRINYLAKPLSQIQKVNIEVQGLKKKVARPQT